MLLTQIASNPHLPSGLTLALARYGAAHDPKLEAALVANPAVSITVVDEILNRRRRSTQPLLSIALSRPDVTAERARALLGDSSLLALWRIALRRVADRSGALVLTALEQCRSDLLCSDVLEDLDLPAAVHVAAVRRLLDSHTGEDPMKKSLVARIATSARRHPEVLQTLHAQGLPAALRDAIAPIPTPGPLADAAEPADRTASAMTGWLAAAPREGHAIVEVCTRTRSVPVWQAALRGGQHTDAVAAAAMTQRPSKNLLREVAVTRGAASHDRRTALLEFARLSRAAGGGLPHKFQRLAEVLAADAPAHWVVQVLPLVGDFTARRIVTSRLDLPREALAVLRPTPGGVRRVEPSEGYLCLATYPSATFDDRLAGVEALVDLRAHVAEQHTARGFSSWLVSKLDADILIANAGVAELSVGAVAAVRDLPVAVFKHNGFDGAAMRMLADALAQIVPDVADDLVAAVLTELAGDFAGTFGELIDASSDLVA